MRTVAKPSFTSETILFTFSSSLKRSPWIHYEFLHIQWARARIDHDSNKGWCSGFRIFSTGMLNNEFNPIASSNTKMISVNCQFLTENSAIFITRNYFE